ncbi:MAG: DEAD/DEAH box helicase family protein, partial [Oscillochloris sp.]|nr:DEAD/DEAH box helicase family protein [Oscillochloris sp.]
KTQLALMAVARLRLQTLVLVPTIELLHQWRSAMIERLGLPAARVGQLGDGRRDRCTVTIATYASASMPDAPISDCGLLIIDEAHHLPAPGLSPDCRAQRRPILPGAHRHTRARRRARRSVVRIGRAGGLSTQPGGISRRGPSGAVPSPPHPDRPE